MGHGERRDVMSTVPCGESHEVRSGDFVQWAEANSVSAPALSALATRCTRGGLLPLQEGVQLLRSGASVTLSLFLACVA